MFAMPSFRASPTFTLKKTMPRTKIQKQAAEESLLPEAPGTLPEGLPPTGEIKQRIIRRVYELIETCTDPKKLMDTYEAISKFERDNGHERESLFDTIARELAGEQAVATHTHPDTVQRSNGSV